MGRGTKEHIRDDRPVGVQGDLTCLVDDHNARLDRYSGSADLGVVAVAFDDNEEGAGLDNDRDEHRGHLRSNGEADGSMDPGHWDAAVHVAHHGCHDAARTVLSLVELGGNCGTHQACNSVEEKGEEKVLMKFSLSETWGKVLAVGSESRTIFSHAGDRLSRPFHPFCVSHPQQHRRVHPV